MRREGPAGDVALRAFLRSAKVAESPAALRALPVPFCAAGSLAGRAYSWTAPLAGFLSLCAASRFSFLLVPKGLIDGYNLKTMYSSLAQCGCRGLCESLILARTFGACKVLCGPAEDGR